MDLYEALMTTRAIRRFTDAPVTDEEIERCLAAAAQAPSGGNIQPYQFVVVRDEDTRARIGELYLAAYERYEPAVQQLVPAFDSDEARERHERNWRASTRLARTIGRAPVHVLVLMPRISMAVEDEQGEMDVGPTYASVYPAVQNFLLAARSQGLGSVLTTVIRIREAEVRALLEIPDRYEIAALLPVGRPAARWGVAARRPWWSLTSWDRFGARRAPGGT